MVALHGHLTSGKNRSLERVQKWCVSLNLYFERQTNTMAILIEVYVLKAPEGMSTDEVVTTSTCVVHSIKVRQRDHGTILEIIYNNSEIIYNNDSAQSLDRVIS